MKNDTQKNNAFKTIMLCSTKSNVKFICTRPLLFTIPHQNENEQFHMYNNKKSLGYYFQGTTCFAQGIGGQSFFMRCFRGQRFFARDLGIIVFCNARSVSIHSLLCFAYFYFRGNVFAQGWMVNIICAMFRGKYFLHKV